jgi:His/Glu/Gln/Arg/opine family amino acid ABC transporter permease subunit
MGDCVINYDIIVSSLPLLVKGALVSLKIMGISFCIGITGGSILGYFHTGKNEYIKKMISLLVTMIRGTPMLVQITFVYYLFPMIGISLSECGAAIWAIGFNSSIYVSQMIRSGIHSVSKEQIESARMLGLNTFQTAWYIVFPQAIRLIFPSLVGECVTLLKDSSLASVIGVMELYKYSRIVMNQTYDVLTVFFIMSVFYLMCTIIIECVGRVIEKKMGSYVAD